MGTCPSASLVAARPASRPPSWAAVARHLGEHLRLERLHPATRGVLECLEVHGGRAVLGFSGGADSLALLLLLHAHYPKLRGNLVALHFNHRLRSRASGGDAAFCRRVCAALGCGYETAEWTNRPSHPNEAEAREARHGFFAERQTMLEAPTLLLGHHLDDVAETQLMRLARGSGAAGLSAPRPAYRRKDGRVILRPLLHLAKADLLAGLTAAGARWREDASNQTPAHLRNRIRHTVVPAWQAAHADEARAVLEGAACSRALLEEDETALELWARQALPLNEDIAQLDVRGARQLPVAVVRRGLRQWLTALPARPQLSRSGFEVLLAKVHAGGFVRFSLGENGFAVVRRGRLSCEPCAPKNPSDRRVRPDKSRSIQPSSSN